jgi:hypothetical protein
MNWQAFLDAAHYLRFLLTHGGRGPSKTLLDLIHEVECTAGNDRSDARAKAKAWLLSDGLFMGQEDILLARTHFYYLLPASWGL